MNHHHLTSLYNVLTLTKIQEESFYKDPSEKGLFFLLSWNTGEWLNILTLQQTCFLYESNKSNELYGFQSKGHFVTQNCAFVFFVNSHHGDDESDCLGKCHTVEGAGCGRSFSPCSCSSNAAATYLLTTD